MLGWYARMKGEQCDVVYLISSKCLAVQILQIREIATLQTKLGFPSQTIKIYYLRPSRCCTGRSHLDLARTRKLQGGSVLYPCHAQSLAATNRVTEQLSWLAVESFFAGRASPPQISILLGCGCVIFFAFALCDSAIS